MKLISVDECTLRNDAMQAFNSAIRSGQPVLEAWEDSTNMELGEYPAGGLSVARRIIAPWHYAKGLEK